MQGRAPATLFFKKKEALPNHNPLRYNAYLIPVSIVKAINGTPSSSQKLCPMNAHPEIHYDC
jgi:hypothetical protein